MPDPSLLEAFATPSEMPFVIEHVVEEFTSVCPITGHPDYAQIVVRFQPRIARDSGVCVELKSLKLYLQSFRNEGTFYEAATNRMRDDLVGLMHPTWLQIHSKWRGRGGIWSIVRAEFGEIPARFQS